MTHRRNRETRSPLANVGCWAEAKCYRPDELDRFCGSRPIINLTFLVGNENSRSASNPEEEGKQNSGEFQMPRFYFHKHLNGQTVRAVEALRFATKTKHAPTPFA